MKFFDKFNALLNKHFVPTATIIANQRHILAIKDGLILTLPLTIAGSLFLILNFLPIPAYMNFLRATGLSGYFSYVSDATIGLIGMVACLGVSYRMSLGYKMNDLAISNAAISLASFFVTVFPTVTNKNLNVGYLGAKSIFAGMFIALVSVEIIKKIVDRGIVIQMPESVPPAIAKSFMSLIPGILVITFWGFVTAIFANTNFKTFQDAVNVIVGTPLRYVGSSLIGQLLAVFFTTLLWCLGLHGASVVTSVMTALWTENAINNTELIKQGLEPLYSNGFRLSTQAFGDMTMKIGGSGSTLGFVILMFFIARSKQLKEIGKISIMPAIFNINEPVIFGTPIVMNPILMIPFIVAPMITTTISWFAMKLDMVKVPFALIPWTTPPIIGGFLSSGFGISTALLSAINILISIAIFYPFFKIYDSQLATTENEPKKEESLDSLLSDL